LINFDILGLIAGILTSISLLPQLREVLKGKIVNDIAPVVLIILIVGLSLWAWYGVLKTEMPIILSTSFAVIVNLCLFALHNIYRKPKSI